MFLPIHGIAASLLFYIIYFLFYIIVLCMFYIIYFILFYIIIIIILCYGVKSTKPYWSQGGLISETDVMSLFFFNKSLKPLLSQHRIVKSLKSLS